MYRKICALVDGSAASINALEEAVKLAKMSGATILALHVVDLLRMERENVLIWEGDELDRKVKEAAQEVLSTAERVVAGSGVPFASKVVTSQGEKMTDLLLEEAEDEGCDLIAMGTHGYSGVTHLLLGSVAEGVLRKAEVPVLLVRKPD
ncbi:MAG: universal stress protein [Neisseria sp.]|uniref:universal stress protein n=1 Tax=Neisseria sp. TaxID=192066 RepID=UPI0026DD888A|nr:universal stress protein [Neisseria sp.]MDO4641014.1 universal stress protein [Neisseria sp.]